MEIKKGQYYKHKISKEVLRAIEVIDGKVFFSDDVYVFLDIFHEFWELIDEVEQGNTPNYYNNEKGSIYQFCNEQELNSYEFDIIKRVVRCRKKGLFVEDLQKTKNLIDLYLKEFNYEK